MKFYRLNVEMAKGPGKSPAWLPVLLLVVLASIIGLIVHQVRKQPAPPPKQPTQEYGTAMQKMDKSISDLKDKIQERPPLQIDETLSKRPTPPPERIVEPPTPTAALTERVMELKDTVKSLVGREEARPGVEPIPALKGIFWSRTNPLAVLNGETVGLQEKVNGYTVIGIAQDRVTVESGAGDRYEISLYRD